MKLLRIPVVLAILALITVVISGPGARFGLWTTRTGFLMMTWTVYVGLAVAALALVLLLVPRSRRLAAGSLVASVVIALIAVAMPLHGSYTAKRLPMIHDISTDTVRPPEFVAVLPLRADAPNSSVYGGAEIAAAQKAGYPDIATQMLELPPAEAFDRALDAARTMGWEIVASDAGAGRIEATDTTFWYGFKDDVVIRIEAAGSGSRIDIRSVSRRGKSDVGKNAARIRAYVKKLGSRPIAN